MRKKGYVKVCGPKHPDGCGPSANNDGPPSDPNRCHVQSGDKRVYCVNRAYSLGHHTGRREEAKGLTRNSAFRCGITSNESASTAQQRRRHDGVTRRGPAVGHSSNNRKEVTTHGGG